MAKVVRVDCHWDTDGDTEGWYCQALRADGTCVEDSMKMWFPVDVDDFNEHQGDKLARALKRAYRGAEIVGLD
jgi:hypothetical protein